MHRDFFEVVFAWNPRWLGSAATFAARSGVGCQGQYRLRLADSINELIADPERASRFGAAGRKRAELEFSWAAMAEQTVEVYRSVI